MQPNSHHQSPDGIENGRHQAAIKRSAVKVPVIEPAMELRINTQKELGFADLLGRMTSSPASWWFWAIHLKNMLLKMGSSSPRIGVKISKIFETIT